MYIIVPFFLVSCEIIINITGQISREKKYGKVAALKSVSVQNHIAK